MINTIEKQKESQRTARDSFLLSRIEAMEKDMENQKINEYYNNIAQMQLQVQQAQQAQSQAQAQAQEEFKRRRRIIQRQNKLTVITEEELKKNKDSLLIQESKRTELLKEMGLSDNNETQNKPAYSMPTQFDNNSIKNRIMALRSKHKQSVERSPFQKFRGMARVVSGFFILQKYAKTNGVKRREGMLLFMNHDITLHLDITRVWVLTSIKPVLLSVICYILRF